MVHTRVRYSAGGADGGVFFRKVPALQALVGDGPMGELMPPVAPTDDELVIVKQYASAFFGTSLASTLHAAGVDTVVVVGVSTSGCIRATAVDAIQHGFVPLVVADAVGDRAPDRTSPTSATCGPSTPRWWTRRPPSTTSPPPPEVTTGDVTDAVEHRRDGPS